MAQQAACGFVVLSVKDGTMSEKEKFIVGVSGHRDVFSEDFPELEMRIRTIFDRFRLAYPNAGFELLSPLAEGADRMAAKVAVEDGITLIVPMPMGQHEYEQDFTTSQSLNEFRRLLAAAARSFEISSEVNNRRADKYAGVGDYIARRSHLLILLWDGEDNKKIGGTAWVKQRREFWMNSAKARGDAPRVFGYAGTIQIVTPRRGNADRRPEITIIGDLPRVDSGGTAVEAVDPE